MKLTQVAASLMFSQLQNNSIFIDLITDVKILARNHQKIIAVVGSKRIYGASVFVKGGAFHREVSDVMECCDAAIRLMALVRVPCNLSLILS